MNKENNITDNINNEQPCCPSTSNDCGCSSGCGNKIKIIIFVVILLLAALVAGHAIMAKNNNPTSCSIGTLNSGFDTQPLVTPPAKTDTLCATDAKAPLAAQPCPMKSEKNESLKQTAVLCGTNLASLAELNSLAADKKAVFILLAGDSQQATEKVGRALEQTSKTITEKGTPVAIFTLDSNKDDYARLVKDLSIESFPSVVVMGKGAGVSVVSGTVNETNLLTAFVKATTSSCDPIKSTGCCPK